MHRYWKSILQPVLRAYEPKVIVEIGSDTGKNTRNLLEHCRDSGETSLHAIDPVPRFPFEEWKSEFGESFVLHKAPSLEALRKIEFCDLALIDGDYNWYTVFHELKQLDAMAKRGGRTFPLVFLHDVGWPYGRRDLYHDPDDIPEEDRHPFKRQGMVPGQSRLVDRGGLNYYFNNAVHEHGKRNGVLTAIEDFMEGSTRPFDFRTLPAFHGLGMLVDRNDERAWTLLDKTIVTDERFADFLGVMEELESDWVRLRTLVDTQAAELARGGKSWLGSRFRRSTWDGLDG